MLGFMRKHAKGAFIKIVFWMIIIVFVFWGVGVMVSGGDKVNVAAMVNGEPITAQEYARAFENMQRVYQQLYRENFTPQVAAQLNLHARALDDLVNDRLLKREARRLGLQVTDDEVRDAILNIPNFRSGDHFDRTRYLAALRATRTTPTEFEESQRESLLITKLENLLTDGITVTEHEVRDLYALDHDTIDVAFAKVPYAPFHDAATASDAEVSEYYEKNREVFRRPERVTLAYVAYSPKDLEPSVAVSDESVAAYYDSHQSDYETPEKIHLREILFVVPAGADDAARAAIRTTAEGVVAEAKGGGDFAALARTHSGDPLTKDAGGDLGFVERGKLDAAVDEAAFALETGQVSDLVETPRGFAILEVDEKQASGTQPLAEVRDAIVKVLRENGAEQAARDAVDADLERARNGTPIENLAAARGLTVTTPPSASRAEPLPGVTGPVLLASALALDAGAIDEIVGTEPPYYLFKVTEKIPSDIKPLADVRTQIVETVRTNKARAAAHAAADELLTAAKAAGSGAAGLTSAAKAKTYAVEETGPFNRTQPLPKLGTAPIKDELFALTKDEPFATVNELPDAAVVLALKERAPADQAALADSGDSLRDGATSRKRSAVLDAYRDMLRQRSDITVNPDIVTGART
jgi:peptidyl-prolyl cis-trans isomerase D